MTTLFSYMAQHASQIFGYTITHIEMTSIAVGVSILIGVPLGILIGYVRGLNRPVIAIANIFKSIPSMSLQCLCIH